MSITKKVLSLRQVGERLGICAETARRWAVIGKIPAFRYDERGRWRVYESELDAWIAQCKDKGESGQEVGVSQ